MQAFLFFYNPIRFSTIYGVADAVHDGLVTLAQRNVKVHVPLDFRIGHLALGNVADVALNDIDTFANGNHCIPALLHTLCCSQHRNVIAVNEPQHVAVVLPAQQFLRVDPAPTRRQAG